MTFIYQSPARHGIRRKMTWRQILTHLLAAASRKTGGRHLPADHRVEETTDRAGDSKPFIHLSEKSVGFMRPKRDIIWHHEDVCFVEYILEHGLMFEI
jgi:hypothetical protein